MSGSGMIAHPSRQARAAIWALAIALLTPGLLTGQSASPIASVTVSGHVRDARAIPVPGAVVSLQREYQKGDQREDQRGDGTTTRTTTNADGSYAISAVAEGSYTLRANAPGYREATFASVTVAGNHDQQIDLTLELASVSSAPSAKLPEFFDEPHFTVSDVTDTTSLGGHGSDTIVRTRESLVKETASLGKPSVAASQPVSPEATAKELREAEERTRAAIAHEDKAELHHLLADTNEKLGKPLDAVREYQRAAEMDPSEPNLFDWGAELLLHRAPQPAIEVFTQGHQLFPSSVRMLVSLGVAWYAEGSNDQAAKRLGEAADLNPDNPVPYLFLGKIQSAEATPSDAIVEKLARFARLQPDNAMANYYYAVSLWKRRTGLADDPNLAQVRALLENAIRLDPKLGAAYLQLGILYPAKNDLPRAISYYQKAIEANPRLEEAHYRLAQAYRLTGETSQAQAELQLYQQLTKNSAGELERERHESKQFVYTLKDQPGYLSH
jgi:tetratricopeptide (TPR) repeat protein